MASYQMSVFKIQETTLKEMDKVQRNFWWGRKDGKGVCLLSWPTVGKEKCNGCMGFRNLSYFNQAMLAKTAWRLCNQQDQLWARALKQCYYPNSNALHAKKKETPLGPGKVSTM